MREFLGKTMMSSAMTSNILLGLGVLWAGQMIVPLLRGAVRPVAVKGAQGAIAISEQTSSVLERAREELTRIIEDAKEGRQMAYTGAGMGAGMMGMNYLNNNSNQELNELKAKIAALESQLAEAKDNKDGSFENKSLPNKDNKI